jgi:hypothetical protein
MPNPDVQHLLLFNDLVGCGQTKIHRVVVGGWYKFYHPPYHPHTTPQIYNIYPSGNGVYTPFEPHLLLFTDHVGAWAKKNIVAYYDTDINRANIVLFDVKRLLNL